MAKKNRFSFLLPLGLAATAFIFLKKRNTSEDNIGSSFQELTTVTGRKLKVRSNKSERTFTIITESGKYKTYTMSKEEFNDSLYNTGNDWNNFLKTGDYYKVK